MANKKNMDNKTANTTMNTDVNDREIRGQSSQNSGQSSDMGMGNRGQNSQQQSGQAGQQTDRGLDSDVGSSKSDINNSRRDQDKF